MKKYTSFLFIFCNLVLVVGLAWWLLSLAHAPAGMSLELTSNMETINPEERAELRFLIRDSKGTIEMDFERVHEKLMHLIVVRQDLSEFQHLHPEFNKETGEFSVTLSFPSAGSYQLYADFEPMHLPQTVLSFSVNVGEEEAYVAQAFVLSEAKPFVVDGFTVTPKFPERIETNVEANYLFEVSRDDKTVTLEDYLGAKGHSVVLRKDSLDYIHSHPDDDTLDFHVFFSEEGSYQSYTQFQVDGVVHTIFYAFEVMKGSLEVPSSEEDVEHLMH